MKTHGEDGCAKAEMGRCFYKARNGEDRRARRKLGERSGAYSPRESSAGTNPAATSGLQNREGTQSCYFKPPGLWSFVTAAPAGLRRAHVYLKHLCSPS